MMVTPGAYGAHVWLLRAVVMDAAAAVLPPATVRALNENGGDAIASCASTACALIQSESRSRVKRAAATPTVDVLVAVYAEAIRRDMSPAALTEAAEATKLARDVVAALCDGYAAGHEGMRATKSASATAHADLPQLTSVSFEVAHQLGDRSTVPGEPVRSLPAFTYRLGTSDGDVTFQCTTEQAQALLEELRTAVQAAERVAKR